MVIVQHVECLFEPLDLVRLERAEDVTAGLPGMVAATSALSWAAMTYAEARHVLFV
jgi:hypothetical protein